MNGWVFAASPDAVKEFLDGGGEYQPPPRLLTDLTEAQAVSIPPGSPYSIAQILAHMHFFPSAQIAKVRGEEWPQPQHLDDTFAPIAPGTWPTLVADFLTGVEACKTLAQEMADRTGPEREDTSVDYDLAESALPNAYHFARSCCCAGWQGFWPPVGGDTNDS